MLLLQHERSVQNQLHRQLYAAPQRGSSEADGPGHMQDHDHRARHTRAFHLCADITGAVGLMTKRAVSLFLPWSAVFLVSSTLAYGLTVAVVGGSTNSSKPAEAMVVSPLTTSQELLNDPQLYALDSCLTAWSRVSAERPEIYAAGLEQFIAGGCGAP
jgi:hypothetical protein